jgi:frataxin
MLENSQFHCLADAYLDALTDEIEAKDAEGLLDAEVEQGVLTLTLPSGKQYVVSKHLPSKQLWLSSPISGGLHFSYDEAHSAWALADGRKLCTLLADELAHAIGIEFRFAS